MRRTKSPSQYQDQAVVFKALGHAGRLLMVDELSRRKLGLCELAELLGTETATVTRHLYILRHAGIVQDEKQGNNVLYHLKTPCVMKVFDCVAAVREQERKTSLTAAM